MLFTRPIWTQKVHNGISALGCQFYILLTSILQPFSSFASLLVDNRDWAPQSFCPWNSKDDQVMDPSSLSLRQPTEAHRIWRRIICCIQTSIYTILKNKHIFSSVLRYSHQLARSLFSHLTSSSSALCRKPYFKYFTISKRFVTLSVGHLTFTSGFFKLFNQSGWSGHRRLWSLYVSILIFFSVLKLILDSSADNWPGGALGICTTI